ncbi:MAG: Glycosyl transferase [Microgenomates group bacterium GW2011_GWB1_40_9]|nr:MAG: Glycosyl transferase [Microgenomates group bacterium GW2011_GWB1_40_9]
MSKPFFSIILPTKNRPVLLRDAIRSVLSQNFDDYELIVSDNFNDETTKKAVEEFKKDSHLIYIRTDRELNIPDHWEFAGKRANGIYTLILTDRAFLKQGALQDIYDTIKGSKDQAVIFWKYGYFDEERGVLESEKEEAGLKILNSTDLLKDFGRTLDAHFLPRPHVGCYREDLIEKIRRDVGRLYLPYGPDFTSSLLVLSYSENVVFIPRPLVFFQGATLSAGTKAQSSIVTYLNSLNLHDPYKYVPIKAPINGNLIFNDFLKIRDIAGRNFRDISVNWSFYFNKCYQELREKGIIWKVNKETLADFWKEWTKALLSFDEETQTAVKKNFLRTWISVLKSFLKATPVGNILVKIKRAISGKPTFHYSSALEAGGFIT